MVVLVIDSGENRRIELVDALGIFELLADDDDRAQEGVIARGCAARPCSCKLEFNRGSYRSNGTYRAPCQIPCWSWRPPRRTQYMPSSRGSAGVEMSLLVIEVVGG